MHYDTWKRAVDAEILRKTGMTSDDLDDWRYASDYEEKRKPKQSATRAIWNAKGKRILHSVPLAPKSYAQRLKAWFPLGTPNNVIMAEVLREFPQAPDAFLQDVNTELKRYDNATDAPYGT